MWLPFNNLARRVYRVGQLFSLDIENRLCENKNEPWEYLKMEELL